MIPAPAHLAPVFAEIADGTRRGDQVLRHVAQLAPLPEDAACRMAYLGTLYADDPLVWCAAGWLRLHSSDTQGQEGGQA